MKRRFKQWWETIASISTKHTTELVSLTFHSDLRKLNTGASHQVSVHLAKQFQKKNKLEQLFGYFPIGFNIIQRLNIFFLRLHDS
jgi:hypothetical protein